jgi:hypothetical protein
MSTKSKNISWADMDEEEEKQEVHCNPCPSYASVAKLGIPDSVSDSDSVRIAKCESALLEWVKNKNSSIVVNRDSPNNKQKQITCQVCFDPFIFDEKMKNKYVERGWKMPKTCRSCCQSRHETREKAGYKKKA